jgi:LPXTG-site transpeptidase (sortase) family protein
MDKILLWKISSIVSAIFGVLVLTAVLYPIISYESSSREKYPALLSPIVKDSFDSRLESFDYTRASNWFVDAASKEEFLAPNISHYTLTIPKLGIKDATVVIGGEDLSESLIQYPGTASPGKLGNTVVFGHSILPQFFNPKNYIAIFSTLPTLEKGDVVKVEYDGVSYEYAVEAMFEVLPTDLRVLDQEQRDSYISLVTCVPPGHPLRPRRLVVQAKIVPLGGSNALKSLNADIGS